MPFKVCWNDASVASLEAVVDFLRLINEDAASNLAARLYRAGETLKEFPNRGRTTAGGTREILDVRPYAIRYRVIGERVEILRIRDLRRFDDG